MGRINIGDSAKTTVEPGQHLVVAVTEDGVDQVKQLSEVKAGSQTVVSIELMQVRADRLKNEQHARDKADLEARDKAVQEAKDKSVREQQAREQQERERAAREAADGVWTDLNTGLIWTKKDNVRDVTWKQATDYCRNLHLGGHSGWRLPTIDELQGIYDANANVGGYHIKGNLQLSNWWHWSSSQGNASGETWSFSFLDGGRLSSQLGYGYGTRAMCLRHSGQ
jgi:hypothetical protein